MTNESKNLKIAVFHELPYGGARRAVIEFGKELNKKHKVDLYYIDEKKEKEIDSNFTKINFLKFTPKIWKGNNWTVKLYKDSIELFKLYRLHNKIAKKIDNSRYDFVFVHGSKYTQAPFILRFLETKSAYYCQEPLRMVYEDLFKIPEDLNIFKKFYEKVNRKNRKQIDKKNINSADLVLANSKYTSKNIRKAYGINATVSYMGLDEKIFYPEEIRKKHDILFIGSRSKEDGYYMLMDALKLIKKKINTRLLLREDEWIDDDNEMRKLYSSSKIMTGLSFNEPFGLQPIEAQACGVVVIGVRNGGYMETVKDNLSGFLISRNSKELSKKILELLGNEKLLNSMSKSAVMQVDAKWTWKKNTEILLKNINDNLTL